MSQKWWKMILSTSIMNIPRESGFRSNQRMSGGSQWFVFDGFPAFRKIGPNMRHFQIRQVRGKKKFSLSLVLGTPPELFSEAVVMPSFSLVGVSISAHPQHDLATTHQYFRRERKTSMPYLHNILWIERKWTPRRCERWNESSRAIRLFLKSTFLCESGSNWDWEASGNCSVCSETIESSFACVPWWTPPFNRGNIYTHVHWNEISVTSSCFVTCSQVEILVTISTTNRFRVKLSMSVEASESQCSI